MQLRRRRFLLLLLLLGALLPVVGCGEMLSKLWAKPEVAFRGVRLGQVGLTSGTLLVRLLVSNSNGYALRTTRLTYTITSGGKTIGTGVYDRPVEVAAHDSATVELPVELQYAALGDAGRRLLLGEVVDYRIAGDMTVALPVGSITHPFEVRGEAGPRAAGQPRP